MVARAKAKRVVNIAAEIVVDRVIAASAVAVVAVVVDGAAGNVGRTSRVGRANRLRFRSHSRTPKTTSPRANNPVC